MHFKKILRFLYITILLLKVTSDHVVAQESKISMTVNPIVIAHVGRSYGINFQYDISNKLRVYLGAKYHQNLLVDPVLNSQIFRYRFRANNDFQHIGYSIGGSYFMNWKHSIIKPYIYYDLTYFNMDTRTLVFSKVDTAVNTNITQLLKVTPKKYNDLHSFENNIGVGLVCPLTQWLSINTRGGIGTNVISNLPTNEYKNGTHTELSLQYTLGFQFDF